MNIGNEYSLGVEHIAISFIVGIFLGYLLFNYLSKKHICKKQKAYTLQSLQENKENINIIEILQNDKKKLSKDLEEAQAQLKQIGKLSQLGEIAAGVAHELNTPLSTILATVRLLNDTSSNEEQIKLRGIITSAASRCASIIKKLLLFTRSSPEKDALIDIEGTLDATISLLEHQMNLDKIAIMKKITKTPLIKGDASEFSQVFTNLLLNARDAILTKVSQLEAFQRTLTYSPKITISLFSENDFAVVDVHDNGVGILPENMENIFQPFFTTKDVGKGTGLGLYISKLIVEKWGGTIKARSTPHEGTHFIVSFPRTQS